MQEDIEESITVEPPKPKPKPEKNTPEVKQKIDVLLEELRKNILGGGNASKQIKEIRELARMTTKGKFLNKGLEYIQMAIRRKWWTQAYDRISNLRAMIKEL
jgi:hypothetical protein